ncbi:Cation-independent mannose-6-phosphate receptor CI-MPR, partial [Coemansia sp. BCRC 34490]
IDYDLRPLELASGSYAVDGLGSGYSFELNICGSLPGYTNKHGAVRWQTVNTEGIIGQPNDHLRIQGENVIMEYTGGDLCKNVPQKRQSAQIVFACDHSIADSPGKPEFIAEWEHCAFMFLWRTPVACRIGLNNNSSSSSSSSISEGEGAFAGSNDTDDNMQSTSRGAVIFVAVFVFGSIYMLGGILYNRVMNMSSGLRGAEQLPNYRFWRAIYLFCKQIVVGVTNGTIQLVDLARGRRRGLIRIDSAELHMRSEIFDSTNEYPDDDDDDNGTSYRHDHGLVR